MDVESLSNDELEPEISWVKGVLGEPSGGTHLEPIWRPLKPGGECFASFREYPPTYCRCV